MLSTEFVEFWLHHPVTVIASILTMLILVWTMRIVQYRLEFKALHRSMKPPPFGMVLGTIPAMAKTISQLPRDIAPSALVAFLYREHGLGPMFYLDNWPVTSSRQMVICDPSVAAQVVQGPNLPKDPIIRQLLVHICGEHSLFFTEGAQWRRGRTLFNPGFSMNHLMTLVPSIVDDVSTYCTILSRQAELGEVFPVEQTLMRLTMDIMGHLILGHDINSQMMDNKFVDAFEKSISWTPSPNFNINPVAPIMRWYYAQRMNRYLMKVLDDRYKAYNPQSTTESRKETVIDLALHEHAAEANGRYEGKAGEADDAFKQYAVDQMKTFMLAGTNSTASTISYIYYLLDLHPASLAKVKKEYVDVFGSDSSKTATFIKTDSRLLNKLVFTTAVIKGKQRRTPSNQIASSVQQTLRLYPAASTARLGDSIITHDGQEYPTRGQMLWINQHIIHRRADLFPSPDEFIPERFLPAPDHWQEIPKNAWRPFEKGPRACLGQELAMLEMKIVMAMTLRDYDIKGAYDAWDRKLRRNRPGETLDGKRGAFGYRAYQIMEDSAKPVDGMPVKVKKIL